MITQYFKQGIFYILFILFAISAQAQITVLEPHKTDTTAYINANGLNDSILFFYYPDENGNDIRPTLSARLLSDPDKDLEFRWFKFNFEDTAFESTGQADVGVKESKIYDAKSGGYRVDISGDGVDTSFVVWLNRQLFDLYDIELAASECNYFELDARVSFNEEYAYFNPADSQRYIYQNGLNYTWTANDSILSATSDELKLYTNETVSDVPTKETRYWVRISDSLNFKREFYYDIDEDSEDKYGNKLLIAVDADFTAIGPNDDKPRTTDTVITPFEAPHGIFVFNESSPTAELFEWRFYDYKSTSLIGYSELFEPVDSIYYRELPENVNADVDSILKYNVMLMVYGPESVLAQNDNNRCVDSVKAEDFVQVFQSNFPNKKGKKPLEMPNVFTPHNGGDNDYYYFVEKNKPKSLQYFSIKIYNRWGNKIYEYEDNDGSWNKDGNDHAGWDGTTRFGGKVKPGVYYYAAKAIGYKRNGDGFEEFESFGFFHVFY